MTWAILLAAAVLAGVAVAGVLGPLGPARGGGLERAPDPLEEERQALLRALRELEDERAVGELPEATYRLLRAETEARAVAVLRALEARDGAGELVRGLREVRATGARPSPDGRPAPPSTLRRLAPLAALLALLIAVAPVLVGAVRPRTAGEPITGDLVGGAANPLAPFEQRVREHPNDLAARLDLADRYLAAGEARAAIAQYLAALRIDPRNPEALTAVGFLLYEAGRPRDGLAAVERALGSDPDYPEALYDKGVILLWGLDRPREAAGAFRAYLVAAPFGAHRDEVRRILDRIEPRTP